MVWWLAHRLGDWDVCGLKPTWPKKLQLNIFGFQNKRDSDHGRVKTNVNSKWMATLKALVCNPGLDPQVEVEVDIRKSTL